MNPHALIASCLKEHRSNRATGTSTTSRLPGRASDGWPKGFFDSKVRVYCRAWPVPGPLTSTLQPAVLPARCAWRRRAWLRCCLITRTAMYTSTRYTGLVCDFPACSYSYSCSHSLCRLQKRTFNDYGVPPRLRIKTFPDIDALTAASLQLDKMVAQNQAEALEYSATHNPRDTMPASGVQTQQHLPLHCT